MSKSASFDALVEIQKLVYNITEGSSEELIKKINDLNDYKSCFDILIQFANGRPLKSDLICFIISKVHENIKNLSKPELLVNVAAHTYLKLSRYGVVPLNPENIKSTLQRYQKDLLFYNKVISNGDIKTIPPQYKKMLKDPNDATALKDIVDEGFPLASIGFCIKTDDVESLKRCVEGPGFDDNQTIHCRDALFFLNKNIKAEMNLIELAAFYGAEKCLTYLQSKNLAITPNAIIFSFVGDNVKILEKLDFDKADIQTCLEMGIKACSLNAIDFLKQKMNIAKYNVLPLSSRFISYALLKMFLDVKCNVDDKDENDMTAIMWCAYKNMDSAVEYLMSKNASVKCKDKKGNTLLMMLAERGKTDILVKCIKSGANVNEKAELDQTCLMKAAKMGHVDTCQAIIDNGGKIADKDKHANSALHLASYSGRSAVCKLLRQKGLNVTDKNDQGMTPLMCAAFNGHSETCSLLVDLGSLIDEKSLIGNTALMFAAKNGHRDCCKTLLDKGANINEKNFHRSTPLMWAVNGGSLDCCKFLTNKGADLEQKDHNGFTAFLWACTNKNLEIIQFLASARCNIHETVNGGMNGINLAEQHELPEVVDLLKRLGVKKVI